MEDIKELIEVLEKLNTKIDELNKRIQVLERQNDIRVVLPRPRMGMRAQLRRPVRNNSVLY